MIALPIRLSSAFLEICRFICWYVIEVSIHPTSVSYTHLDVYKRQLLERYGVDAGKIHKVYLSGGFGQKINVKKAMDIGLLPPKFLGKTEAIGNSSLAGAAEYLIDARAGSRTEKIIGNTKEIQLSTNKNFNEYFSEYMPVSYTHLDVYKRQLIV